MPQPPKNEQSKNNTPTNNNSQNNNQPVKSMHFGKCPKNKTDQVTWQHNGRTRCQVEATHGGKVLLNGKRVQTFEEMELVLNMIIKGLCDNGE